MARKHGPQGYRSGRPEEPYDEVRPQAPTQIRGARIAAGIAAVAGAAAAAVIVLRR